MLRSQPYKEIVWPILKSMPKYHKLGDRVVVINNFHS